VARFFGGFNVSSRIHRLNARGGHECATDEMPDTWRQLEPRDQQPASLTEMRRWIESATTGPGIGLLGDTLLLRYFQLPNGETSELVAWNLDLLPRIRLVGVPGRVVAIRGNTLVVKLPREDGRIELATYAQRDF
jgi:hypothetical protein